MEVSSTSPFNVSSAAANDSAKLAEDFDDFLTLLTTQLQHQDPLDPMDSGEFTQQLVSFTGVEQQIQTNQNLETLAALTRLNNVGNIAGYLGNEALIEAKFGDHDTDGVQWQYANSDPTASLTLRVVNEAGSTIFETPGQTGLGIHEFNWDGRNNEGLLVDPGNYGLEISAQDDEGNDLRPAIAVRETITAVETTGNEPMFTIGPNTVGQTSILQLVYGDR